MRRQTRLGGLAAQWAVAPLETHPFGLPQRFILTRKGLLSRLFRARDHVVIGPRRVVVQREVAGLRLRPVSLPMTSFLGVAVRVAPLDELDEALRPRFAYSINLHHREARYCLPLFLAFDDRDVGAEWQAWARVLRLPMLVPDRDGNFTPADTSLGRLKIKASIPRDARKLLVARRPMISLFRHVGDLRRQRPIRGREIIARR